MFNFNDTPHADALNKAIADLLEELDKLTGDSEEYSKTADNLAKLMKIKNETAKVMSEHNLSAEKIELEKKKFAFDLGRIRSWKPSPDAVIAAGASILGILAILHYEKIDAVSSKAIGFVSKP